MVPSYVDNFGILLLDHFHDRFEKGSMLPFPGAVFFELPPVDNVSIQNELFARILAQKMGNLLGFGAVRTQMKIGYNDGSEICLLFHCTKKQTDY